jgi:mRNA (2'-O-methyladenosine-N6-)-methyltransferase
VTNVIIPNSEENWEESGVDFMMDRSETRPATASPMSALSSNASDKHVEALSASLLNLISTNKASLPLRLPELLRHLITSTPRTPGTRPAFRLTDQPVLERCLRTLARSWEHGSLFLQQDQAGELVLVDAQLGGSTRPVERKRKRVTEDDADSAAGSDADGSLGAEEELQFANYDGGPRLGQLSVELKEVYALLQRGTARAKLLAEEVGQKRMLYQLVLTETIVSL